MVEELYERSYIHRIKGSFDDNYTSYFLLYYEMSKLFVHKAIRGLKSQRATVTHVGQAQHIGQRNIIEQTHLSF